MKYKLINKTTGEEHLCEKVTIDGWDYYVNDENIHVGDYYLTFTNKIVMGDVRKCEDSSYNFTHCKKVIATNNPYKAGYNKSQETHPFSEEDMIDFYEWIMEEDPIGSTPEILQLWKEQRTKTLYYE